MNNIKQIAHLTIDDYLSFGYIVNESKESLINSIVDDLVKLEQIEDLTTIEISLLVLEKLNALEIVDLVFIHNILLENSFSLNNQLYMQKHYLLFHLFVIKNSFPNFQLQIFHNILNILFSSFIILYLFIYRY